MDVRKNFEAVFIAAAMATCNLWADTLSCTDTYIAEVKFVSFPFFNIDFMV